MLLTQTAAGSEVEATVQDTVDTITGFNKFIQEKGPDLIAFGIRILMALLIFIICHKVINWIRKITRASMERANSDTGARQFVDSLLKYGLHILLFLAIINSLGVESASIAATVASAGVAVGLALQGSLSNLAGGMLILFLKPFVVGDYIIEDSHGNEGTVKEIQIFYTKLATIDNKTIIVPNGTLANTSLTNVTDKDYRQLDLKMDIAYEADLRLAKKLLQELVKNEPSVIQSMEHNVFVNELGSSSVVLGVRAWVKSEEYWPTRWRMLENIKLTLDENHIDIPYQQITVHQAHMESEK